MQIRRIGASANHGFRSVELNEPTMRWNPTKDSFDLKFSGPAYDFATTSRHNYTLRIEPTEMASVLAQLADQAMSMDADDFAKIFGRALPSLLRLQMMACGIKVAA